jgi:hypothetical protein
MQPKEMQLTYEQIFRNVHVCNPQNDVISHILSSDRHFHVSYQRYTAHVGAGFIFLNFTHFAVRVP